jgi:NAD(P)-dependent dehydrogenase (short-subunit alcohol dehydrogenase family)
MSEHGTGPDTADRRVVVVTGGAGAIGSAVRFAFADAGDCAVGLDVPTRAGTDDAGAIVACDVADEASVAAAFAEVRQRFGPVTVLVNCAGMTGAGTVLDEPPAQWRRILDVNLTAAYLCCREAIPDMRSVGGGKILNVASVNGRFGGSALSGPAYAASKGGLLTLTRFLAREHAKDGIQVNAVAPGPHDTPMWDALDPALRTRILGMLPGRDGPGDPDDLAAAVVFLCSPAARYITGATLDVNGGQWMG